MDSRPQFQPITEDDIAHFLANTPGFFERHAGLLASVQLTSPHSHRAISLQERQAELLRRKIRDLELRAAGMLRLGHDNGAIAERLLEAMARGLWQEPGDQRALIQQQLLALEQRLEGSDHD